MLHFATQASLFPTEMPIRHYAGIGSRVTPRDILQLMTKAATKLESEGWILRSGGAKGADSAFEAGVLDPRHKLIITPDQCTEAAMQLSLKVHPAVEALNDFGKRAHGRNAMIVMGPELNNPVQLILFWAPFGDDPTQVLGGTGQAIRVAKAYAPSVPLRNLYDVTVRRRLEEWLK